MGIFDQWFSTPQVGAATDAGENKIQNWLKRGRVVGIDKISGGGSQGSHRRFTFNGAMEIGIAEALLHAGFKDVERAFKAATVFAHSGLCTDLFTIERKPGCPCPGPGRTIMLVGPEAHFIIYADDTTTINSISALLHRCGGGATIIDAGLVFNRVVTRLGFQAGEVLNEAYGEGEAE